MTLKIGFNRSHRNKEERQQIEDDRWICSLSYSLREHDENAIKINIKVIQRRIIIGKYVESDDEPINVSWKIYQKIQHRIGNKID